MEEEVRTILRDAIEARQPGGSGQGLGSRIPRLSLTTTQTRQPKEYCTLHGLARLPEGRRKLDLQQGLEVLNAELFAGRILPFTSEEAHWYAELVYRREKLGRPMAAADAAIAAAALAHDAALATRDVADFAGIGLELINPWELP